MADVAPRARRESVWIVEDEPAAAALAADICEAGDVGSRVFRSPLPFLRAFRDPPRPSAIVLDWRLEHELTAALFLATRHRFPELPVIYWTANARSSLPAMILDDPMTRVVEKTDGAGAFEGALRWALRGPGPVLVPDLEPPSGQPL
ncbi:MAG: response regulator [Chloroflexota bacterium]|nr:response regulator [Chloroflexota bacterium]